MTRPTVEERFWAKVASRDEGECWKWMGEHDRYGYGRFSVSRGDRRSAHRMSYGYLVGIIPDGLVIDHTCRIRDCVNPAHMEPVTNAENVRRGEVGKHHPGPAATCRRGHPRSPNNVYERIDRHGYVARQCRVCLRAWNQARSRALQAA